jgi:hypothetical protein
MAEMTGLLVWFGILWAIVIVLVITRPWERM